MDNNLPKISVVTPSFNQSDYLEKCIRSVILQGYPNLEYIIMDGGSADGSLEIIMRYEPYITYWKSQPDGGQAAAIAEGFDRSTGKILSWINSDDFLCKGALFRVAEAYRKNSLAGLFYGNSFWVDQRANLRKPFFASPMTYRQWLYRSSTVFQGSVFFTEDAYRDVGKINSKLIYAMEYDLFFKIVKNFPTVYIPYFLACFRDQPDSKSNNIPHVGEAEFNRIILSMENINTRTWKYRILCFLMRNKRRLSRLLEINSDRQDCRQVFDELTALF